MDQHERRAWLARQRLLLESQTFVEPPKRFVQRPVETTFDDRQLYSRPWTIATHANLVADTDLLEYE